MGREGKVSPEDKLFYCEQIILGKHNKYSVASIFNLEPSSVDKWVSIYKALGKEGFSNSQKHRHYSKNLKYKQYVIILMEGDHCMKYVNYIKFVHIPNFKTGL